jgi:hypothetical protein
MGENQTIATFFFVCHIFLIRLCNIIIFWSLLDKCYFGLFFHMMGL